MPGRGDRGHSPRLYGNLPWLEGRQPRIEQGLYERRHAGGARPSLFLYHDVTSTYLEGEHNALCAFGYILKLPDNQTGATIRPAPHPQQPLYLLIAYSSGSATFHISRSVANRSKRLL